LDPLFAFLAASYHGGYLVFFLNPNFIHQGKVAAPMSDSTPLPPSIGLTPLVRHSCRPF
jgi:hypothetical protein